MPACVTHPLSARLVLLAAAAALAASLVFAMIVAEHRDGNGARGLAEVAGRAADVRTAGVAEAAGARRDRVTVVRVAR
jgi:hypothetical protein